MGSFNMTGGISHLPIHYGDEIVAIIGLYNKKTSYGQEFCPGYDFTPLFFPVTGEYNDYGSIENIKEDYNSNYIKEFFEIDDLEEFFGIIDDVAVDRYMGTKQKKLFKKANNKIQDIIKNSFHYKFMKNNHKAFDLHLGFMIDHKFIYDFLSNRKEHNDDLFDIDIEQSYDKTLKFNTIHKKEKINQIKYNLNDPDVFKKLEEIHNKLESNQKLNEEETKFLDNIMDVIHNNNFDIEDKVDKEFGHTYKTHLRYLGTDYEYSFVEKGVGYMFDEYFLYPYKVNEEKLLADENKDAYISFIRFYYTLMDMEIILRQHSYAGQHNSYNTHYDFHKACCDFLEQRIKDEESYE